MVLRAADKARMDRVTICTRILGAFQDDCGHTFAPDIAICIRAESATPPVRAQPLLERPQFEPKSLPSQEASRGALLWGWKAR